MSMCGGPPGRSEEPAGNTSGRTVFCVKFQKEMPGLDAPPWPGELGQRIFDNVSAEAWKLWEERMKMILNEYRLMPWQKEAQEIDRPSTWRTSSSARGQRCRPATSRSRPSSAAETRPSAPEGRVDDEVQGGVRVRSARSTSAGAPARAKMKPR